VTVTKVEKDPASRTMTVRAHFDAPVERVWQVWDDPRQLERWWGPPTYPATVVDHGLRPGDRVSYFMTSPEGEKHHGWWRIVAVNPPHRLEFEEGFADDAGNPSDQMPTTSMTVTLTRDQAGTGTDMVVHSTFPSLEAMEQMLAMGMEEGLTLAMGQIDALLA
jgi:uncharacterized protein YndB with AHSA1/START domain